MLRRARSLLVSAGILLCATAPAASANTVSGTAGYPADSALTYRLTGAEFVTDPNFADYYRGTYAGDGPITLTGEMTITRSASISSLVSMRAFVGPAEWTRPQGAEAEEVTNRTVTQPFAVSFTPTAQQRQAGYIDGGASIRARGDGVCSTRKVEFHVTIAAQTAPPTARALPLGRVMRVGQKYALSYWIKDDTGKAYAYADLFDAGTQIGHAESRGTLTADGSLKYVNVTPSSSRRGPLYFCVWAKNESGATSLRAPRTSCAWLPLLVDIARVSNRCGGAGWDSVVAVENYFGNTSSYYDPGTRRRYTVSFVAACNLHDAGYGGHTVRDRLHRTRSQPLGPIVDFRLWSRKEVDDKFQRDMQLLCQRQIPARARTARRKCVEGSVRYRIVRAIGGKFFDADLMTAGIQSTGARDNS